MTNFARSPIRKRKCPGSTTTLWSPGPRSQCWSTGNVRRRILEEPSLADLGHKTLDMHRQGGVRGWAKPRGKRRLAARALPYGRVGSALGELLRRKLLGLRRALEPNQFPHRRPPASSRPGRRTAPQAAAQTCSEPASYFPGRIFTLPPHAPMWHYPGRRHGVTHAQLSRRALVQHPLRR